MNGRVALVTGGARGIGRAIALKLASLGADVAVLDAGALDTTEQTAAEIRALGVKACALRCDITDADQVAAAVKQVKDELGGVDILVNNAGITRDKLALRMSPEDFDAVINVNLKGTFLMIRALYADFMRKRYGRIVNIASIAGLMGNAGQANYAASKAGVVGLTKTIARELASRGVTYDRKHEPGRAPGRQQGDPRAAHGQARGRRRGGGVPGGRRRRIHHRRGAERGRRVLHEIGIGKRRERNTIALSRPFCTPRFSLLIPHYHCEVCYE